MSVARVFERAARRASFALGQCKSSLFASPAVHSSRPLLLNRSHYLGASNGEVSIFSDVLYSASSFQRFGFSASVSPENDEKEAAQSAQEQSENKETNASAGDGDGDGDVAEQKLESDSSSHAETTKSQTDNKRKRGAKRTAFSDSESEGDLEVMPKDELIKLLLEKEEALEVKQKEIAAMQDKVLRNYAEMENVMERARRESENSKKFAIQNFGKSLLDVADNLGRASSVVKESFAKIDTSQDTSGTVQLLKTFLEGVEMTEKQLLEVFRKFGMVKYDPTNEKFDPNRHNAVFQVPDNSKPEGTVAVVLKAGYTLHDRVIRPAEVGVTHAAAED